MYQKVTILGELVTDPEMRCAANGVAFTRFLVNTARRWTNQDGSPGEETIQFVVYASDNVSQPNNRFLSKGRHIFVEGVLSPDPKTGGPRIWIGDDIPPHACFEIVAQTVISIDGETGTTRSWHRTKTDKPIGYEQALSLYREARQRYEVAMSQLREPVPQSYKESIGMKADKEWLETLQKVASRLYDRIASLDPVVEFLVASGQELEVSVPEFLGSRAKRVEEMAVEIRGWVTKLHGQLDETLRLADEWQLKADQWEKMLRTESPKEAQMRWMKEEYRRDAAEGWATLEGLVHDAGYESWSDYEDTLPD